jgi:Putative Zn-dependent protease, contains TPR repeats
MLVKAYKSNPDSYYILDSLAWAYFKNNKFNKALELMEKVIEMAPGEAISLDHLADIYFAMKRKREAIFFWKQALDLAEPEDMLTEDIIKKLEKNDSG